jgi:16S rRNA (uracil1498-N3)-methyltransferase
MEEAAPDLSSNAGGPRLHVEAVLAAGAAFDLPAPQSHYLAKVMRRQVGDPVLLFDGRSGEWRARIANVGKRQVSVIVEAQTRPLETAPDLWLCATPLKRGRIDWLAEKACELGVARLLPVLTRRTVVDRLNLDRLRAHMIEAAEQCGRTAVPELAEPVSLAALLAAWPAERALIFADETGGPPLAGATAPPTAAILIGPEGGFTPEERAAIRTLPQAVPVGLGPRILRADTAAVAAVAVWQAVQGFTGS